MESPSGPVSWSQGRESSTKKKKCMRPDDKISASQSKIHIPLLEHDLILAGTKAIFLKNIFMVVTKTQNNNS